MNKTSLQRRTVVSALALVGALGLLAGCQTTMMDPYTQTVALTGGNEVPPVSTAATGTAMVTIKPITP
jgi:hypothetical protein